MMLNEMRESKGSASGITEKSPSALRTIREVSEELGVPQHVLRFWEEKFPKLAPLKRRGGRRFYRPEDVELLHRIRRLLYEEGYTIKGAVKRMAQGEHATLAPESPKQSTPQKQTTIAFPSAESRPAPKDRQAMASTFLRRAKLRGVLQELQDMRQLLG